MGQSSSLEVFLIRHGKTEWSESGQHTSYTDIPLTSAGQAQAKAMAKHLPKFDAIYSSPRLRALQTCQLATLTQPSAITKDLAEWNYGDFEGLTTPEIQKLTPSWNLFRDGVPNGETSEQVAKRADDLINVLRKCCSGKVALFSHGHFSRVFIARWLGLSLQTATHFYLSAGSVSILGFEHHNMDEPVLTLLNSLEFSKN